VKWCSVKFGSRLRFIAVPVSLPKPGNTRAVCRKCYVHPAVFEGYLDGTLVARLGGAAGGAPQSAAAELRPDERNVLSYLLQRAAGRRQAGHTRAATPTTKAA